MNVVERNRARLTGGITVDEVHERVVIDGNASGVLTLLNTGFYRPVARVSSRSVNLVVSVLSGDDARVLDSEQVKFTRLAKLKFKIRGLRNGDLIVKGSRIWLVMDSDVVLMDLPVSAAEVHELAYGSALPDHKTA